MLLCMRMELERAVFAGSSLAQRQKDSPGPNPRLSCDVQVKKFGVRKCVKM